MHRYIVSLHLDISSLIWSWLPVVRYDKIEVIGLRTIAARFLCLQLRFHLYSRSQAQFLQDARADFEKQKKINLLYGRE